MLSIVFFFFWSETLWQHISWDIDTREFLDSFAIIRLILKKVSYIKEQSGSEDQHLWNEAVLFQPLCYVTVLRFCLKHTQWNRFRIRWRYTVPLGTDGVFKTDEFSEKFQTAFDPPPLNFGKSYSRFRDKSAYVHYGGTVVYYMILFPMRCM